MMFDFEKETVLIKNRNPYIQQQQYSRQNSIQYAGFSRHYEFKRVLDATTLPHSSKFNLSPNRRPGAPSMNLHRCSHLKIKRPHLIFPHTLLCAGKRRLIVSMQGNMPNQMTEMSVGAFLIIIKDIFEATPSFKGKIFGEPRQW